jgi:hypothetical protein
VLAEGARCGPKENAVDVPIATVLRAEDQYWMTVKCEGGAVGGKGPTEMESFPVWVPMVHDTSLLWDGLRPLSMQELEDRFPEASASMASPWVVVGVVPAHLVSSRKVALERTVPGTRGP